MPRTKGSKNLPKQEPKVKKKDLFNYRAFMENYPFEYENVKPKKDNE